MSQRQLRAIWALLVIGIVFGVMQTIGLIAWKHASDRVGRESDERQRELCAIVELVSPTTGPAPTSERGLQVARGLKAYVDRNCR